MPQGDSLFPVGGELRNVSCHRRIDLHFAFFGEQEDRRRGGDNLGQRGCVKNRVFGHWLVIRNDSPFAISFVISSALALQPEDTTGKTVTRNTGGDCQVHFREFVWK